jgi:copper chaperone CopZ
MTTHTYTVEGMTCDHCRHAVTAELMTLDGVRAVDVDLATGSVAVRADVAPDRERVAAAVEEAGYVLV